MSHESSASASSDTARLSSSVIEERGEEGVVGRGEAHERVMRQEVNDTLLKDFELLLRGGVAGADNTEFCIQRCDDAYLEQTLRNEGFLPPAAVFGVLCVFFVAEIGELGSRWLNHRGFILRGRNTRSVTYTCNLITKRILACTSASARRLNFSTRRLFIKDLQLHTSFLLSNDSA